MAPPDELANTSGATETDLAGLVLPDARTGEPFDLGAVGAPLVLAVIRHRY